MLPAALNEPASTDRVAHGSRGSCASARIVTQVDFDKRDRNLYIGLCAGELVKPEVRSARNQCMRASVLMLFDNST